jgi:integrase
VACKPVRVGTLASYRWAPQHIYPDLGSYKLSALKPEQLQRLYSEKLDEGLTPGSVLIVHSVLHKVLQQATEWGVINRNVASLAKAPRQQPQEPNLLTRAQLETLFEHCRGRWLFPLVHLAIATGLRRG